MQKTGNPITFRDANIFYNKAVKYQRKHSDWMSKPTDFGHESGRGAKRRHLAATNAKADLQKFSMKLVEKSVPQVFSDLLIEPLPINKQDVINISASLTMEVLPGTDNRWNILNGINNMSDYKKSEEAKFSLKGQTLSSVMKHFSMKSHAIFNHQGAIAGDIYWTIREKALEIVNGRSKSTV